MEFLEISKEVCFERENFRSVERYLLAILFKNRDKENILKLINKYLLIKPRKYLILENDKYFSYLYKDFKEYKDFLNQKPEIENKVENSYINEKNILVLKRLRFCKGIRIK